MHHWKTLTVAMLVCVALILTACEENNGSVDPEPPVPLDPLGSVEIFSYPAGATIFFNYDSVGITPDTLVDIMEGSYRLTLTMPQYQDYSRYVDVDSGQMTTVNATMRATCTGIVIGDTTLPPEIDFIDLNPGDSRIYGIANNIDASQVKVVLWALTNIWYVQPYIATPWTTICDDGSWDNSTHGWNTMVAVLVNKDAYTPGSVRYTHPGFEQGVLAFAQYPPIRPDLPIEFSGYTWGIKQSADRFDPGPNYWSASVDNIWVAADGLHLKIHHDGAHWTCPEVYLLESHGYGTYTFELAKRVDNLDQRSVFGCFTYESLSRELDIEFSHALASPNNAQFVVQPYNHSGNIYRYDMPPIQYSTHRIEWQPGHVHFSSWRGLSTSADSLITDWHYTGSDIPPANVERWRFNLWLFGGQPPASGVGDEVVIKSFDYQP